MPRRHLWIPLALILATSVLRSEAQITLATTFAGGNGASGNMFDLVTTSSIVVRGFDVNLDAGTWDLEVYARSIAGTFVGQEQDPAAWTLLGTYPGVLSSGTNLPTLLPKDLTLHLPAGTTRGIYVTTTASTGAPMNYTNGTAVGSVFSSDANLQIREGIGNTYPFGTPFLPRVWNGRVQYSTTIQVPGLFFSSIQSGINLASDGQAVIVAPGTYVENVNFLGKRLLVMGTAGAASTIIDGSGAGPTVSLATNEAPGTCLRGFTVRNGMGGLSQGGGIHCLGSSPTIADCVIENNIGGNSIGAANAGAGGVHCTNFGAMTLRRCTLSGNQGGAALGTGTGGTGGFYFRGLSDVRDCVFNNNTGGNSGAGTGGGGGVSVGVLSTIDLETSSFTNNTGGHGVRGGSGGLTSIGDAAAFALRCTLLNNHGGNGSTGIGGSGGVHFDNGGGRLSSSVVANNTGGSSGMDFGGPGGITVQGDTGAYILNSTIANNLGGPGTSTGPGGCLYYRLINSGSTMTNTIVYGNSGIQMVESLLMVNFEHPVVSHSDVQGGWTGVNNFSADPRFVNPAANDYHLQPSSPCLNAGNGAIFNLPAVDMDGDPRTVLGAPDVGADEIRFPLLQGSGEDLALEVLVEGAPGYTVGMNDTLSLRIHSPGLSLVGTPPVLWLQPYTNGAPPIGLAGAGFPEVHIDPFSAILVFDGTQPGPFGPTLIPPGGLTFYHQVTTSFVGTSVRAQAFSVTPAANNGIFVASPVVDVVFR